MPSEIALTAPTIHDLLLFQADEHKRFCSYSLGSRKYPRLDVERIPNQQIFYSTNFHTDDKRECRIYKILISERNDRCGHHSLEKRLLRVFDVRKFKIERLFILISFGDR